MSALRILGCGLWLAASLAPLGCDSESPTNPATTTTGGGGSGSSSSGSGTPYGVGKPIPADMQRPGDPQKGYDALVNNGYVSCGVPYTAYKQAFGAASPGHERAVEAAALRAGRRRRAGASRPHTRSSPQRLPESPAPAAQSAPSEAGWILRAALMS